jgi:competence protein ComEC
MLNRGASLRIQWCAFAVQGYRGAMSRYLLCLGYVLGLMMTGISGDFWGFPIGAIALLILGIGTACGVPRYWRTGPRAVLWLSAGIVGCLAVFYFHMRMPQPTPTDVSRLVSSEVTREFSNEFEIQGQIEQPPQITQSGRIQFVLRADQARVIDPITERAERVHAFHPVTGKLYVTVPQQQGEALYPGQSIGIVGKMYHPQPALNPGGFDFQAYLYRDGIFSGLYGHEIHKIREDQPSFLSTAWLQRQTWRVKQRILSAQVQGLGNPRGLLTTAMAIGKQGIGVPADLRQQFTQAGLAHTLAASGFHVSLLLGIMLRLTQRYSSNLRLAIGVTTLMGYVSLTGIQPSVLRAGIMGIAALVALTTERKVRPLGSLLMAGTLLLLVEPRWIWDLGFQFSFLATLGLLVTAPTLTRWLDWLPPTIASAIAIPLAAYLWTLPLQLWTFGIVSPYSIMVNVLATPLVTLISLGSMISSVAALIYPPIGSFLASLLLYPTDGLIGITQLTRDLPGSAYALGTLSSWTVWCIYGLFLLIMWQQRWQRHWWIIGGISRHSRLANSVSTPQVDGVGHIRRAGYGGSRSGRNWAD